MKLIILIALIAFAVAAPVDDKKVAEDKKSAEKPEQDQNKKPAADEIKKPDEKKDDDTHRGLEWPLPDPINEGDLMLYGVHFFDRVGELRKGKLDTDMDKMVLFYGREYLRRVHKYLEKTPEFKILPIFCRDSLFLNSTKRWAIRFRPEQQPAAAAESKDQTEEKAQPTETDKQNDAPAAAAAKPKQQNDEKFSTSNVTANENATNFVAAVKPFETFEARRVDHYERMGENFARVYLKKYRKEKLVTEEIEYLERWVADESIHYGVMGIYCHDGENIKETFKHIAAFIDEKQ